MQGEKAGRSRREPASTRERDTELTPNHQNYSRNGRGTGSSPQHVLIAHGAYPIDSNANGRLGTIVDTNAYIDILGSNLAGHVAQTGMQHGHQPSQVRLGRTLLTHGAGQTSQSCKWSVNIPNSGADKDLVPHFRVY